MATTKNPGIIFYQELSEQRPKMPKDWFKKPMEFEELETLLQVVGYVEDYFLMAARYKAGLELRRHKKEQGKGYWDWASQNLTLTEKQDSRLRKMADNVDEMVEEGHKLVEIFKLTLKELYKSKPLRPGEEPPPPKPRAIAEKPEEASQASSVSDDGSGPDESEGPEGDTGLVDIIDSLNDESPVDATPEEAAINKAKGVGEPPEDKDDAKAWVVESLERELQATAQVLLLSTDKRRRKILLMECFFKVAELTGVPLKNKTS